MAYGEFKDLTRRTGCEKILRGKAFNITKNQKYDGYQGEHVPMVYKFFDKMLLVAVLKIRIFQRTSIIMTYNNL